MPRISLFYGIAIYMYFDDHSPKHFHATYGEYTGYFDFDGNIIEGNIPEKKQKLISAWAIIHKEDLEENWKALSDGEQPIQISPLQ